MDKLEKVEVIREKTGVSYDDAKAALEACNDDVLDAIIWLERLGKASAQSATYTTTATVEPDAAAPSPEMAQAQTAYQQSAKRQKVHERLQSVFAYLKSLLKKSLDTAFVAEKDGERVVALPILFVILGIFLWGATLWLLILGLFLGLRYHIEGISRVTVDFNQMMDKAGEVADSIKNDVTGGNASNKDDGTPKEG